MAVSPSVRGWPSVAWVLVPAKYQFQVSLIIFNAAFLKIIYREKENKYFKAWF
jgi:hypothetical protein